MGRRHLRRSTSLDLRVPTIPPNDSKEYAAFVQKVLEATAVPAAPKSTGTAGVASSSASTSTPASATSQPKAVPHVPTPETHDIYKRGEEEAKRKNWANAIEAFGSAAKADPQYPDAWRELGRAHMYARRYQDAEAAFRKYRNSLPTIVSPT